MVLGSGCVRLVIVVLGSGCVRLVVVVLGSWGVRIGGPMTVFAIVGCLGHDQGFGRAGLHGYQIGPAQLGVEQRERTIPIFLDLDRAIEIGRQLNLQTAAQTRGAQYMALIILDTCAGKR